MKPLNNHLKHLLAPESIGEAVLRSQYIRILTALPYDLETIKEASEIVKEITGTDCSGSTEKTLECIVGVLLSPCYAPPTFSQTLREQQAEFFDTPVWDRDAVMALSPVEYAKALDAALTIYDIRKEGTMCWKGFIDKKGRLELIALKTVLEGYPLLAVHNDEETDTDVIEVPAALYPLIKAPTAFKAGSSRIGH